MSRANHNNSDAVNCIPSPSDHYDHFEESLDCDQAPVSQHLPEQNNNAETTRTDQELQLESTLTPTVAHGKHSKGFSLLILFL